MTFRSRLVAAAAIAVVLAVLGACAAAYVASRDSLVSSIDGTLRATAHSALRGGPIDVHQNSANGLAYQIVDSSGQILTGGGLPVSAEAKAAAAGHDRGYSFTTITLQGAPYRELIVGTVRAAPAGTPFAPTIPAAFQLALPLTSVNHQLAHLRWALVLIVVAGLAIAVALAWLVGRTALVPLNDLTSAVEDVASTTDVSRRLDPGGPDELGQLRRAFNHLLAALERSQQAQRQLVLDAGHELRTPLTSLRTNLEVVRRLDELSPDDRDVLVNDLLTQMGELTNLVGDLSELARGDQRPQEPVPFRLDRVVEEAVGVATTHGRSRDVQFHLAMRPTWMCGRHNRVTHAVGNLLDNALKWSPDGGIVEVHCADGSVTVRDHGPGISSEDLPHIFDRFYRAAAARRLPGSGLGLAIVAQVAEAEGGSVVAGHTLDGGGGAVFTLRFPTVAAPAPGWTPGAGTRMAPGDDDGDDDEDEDEDESPHQFALPSTSAGPGAAGGIGAGTGTTGGDPLAPGAEPGATPGSTSPSLPAGTRDDQGERHADPDAGVDAGAPTPGWGLPGS